MKADCDRSFDDDGLNFFGVVVVDSTEDSNVVVTVDLDNVVAGVGEVVILVELIVVVDDVVVVVFCGVVVVAAIVIGDLAVVVPLRQ